MSYSCLEELQVDLDLHVLDKKVVLSKAGRQCNEGWFVITDDGYCYLFDRNDNLDDNKKVTYLNEYYIRRDIAKIIIPDSVIDIEKYTFLGCITLTSVIIPSNVKSIGDYAFYACSMLMNMSIGNGITNIWRSAFFGCNSLTNLTFKGKTLEQVKKMDGYPWGIEDESIIRVE